MFVKDLLHGQDEDGAQGPAMNRMDAIINNPFKLAPEMFKIAFPENVLLQMAADPVGLWKELKDKDPREVADEIASTK